MALPERPLEMTCTDTIEEVVRRIAGAVSPEKIITLRLNGARRHGPDSDLDLLVIKSGDFATVNSRGASIAPGKRLFQVDIVVAAPEEVACYRDEPCLAIYPALREGYVVYDAAA